MFLFPQVSDGNISQRVFKGQKAHIKAALKAVKALFWNSLSKVCSPGENNSFLEVAQLLKRLYFSAIHYTHMML